MAKKSGTETITFHNKISPNYRSMHVDGVFGGVTPKGFINLSFYSERFPIPKSTEFIIESDTQKIVEMKNSPDSKNGLLKEYEFGVYMDVATAKKIVSFLQEEISELETLLNSQKDGNDTKK